MIIIQVKSSNMFALNTIQVGQIVTDIIAKMWKVKILHLQIFELKDDS